MAYFNHKAMRKLLSGMKQLSNMKFIWIQKED